MPLPGYLHTAPSAIPPQCMSRLIGGLHYLPLREEVLALACQSQISLLREQIDVSVFELLCLEAVPSLQSDHECISWGCFIHHVSLLS